VSPKKPGLTAVRLFLHVASARLAAVCLLLSAIAVTSACNNALEGFSPSSQMASRTRESKRGFTRIAISPTLPSAVQGTAYNAVMSVQGGSSPYQFSVRSGSLPTGLSLNATTGSISGKPSVAGSFDFTIGVVDSSKDARGAQSFSVAVSKATTTSGVKIAISPTASSMNSGARLQFTAFISNTSNTAVKWSASAGTISTVGLYTAPTVASSKQVTVTATSSADPKALATASVNVAASTVGTTLTIATTSVPDATVGSSYSASLSASGGQAPYQWNVSAGSLPSGVSLDSNTGTFSGTPIAEGTFNFVTQVTDSSSAQASQAFSMTVSSAASGAGFDGPAELPRIYVSSAMSDTPAPGNIITVNAGGDLQGALDHAACGDTITLQAGATFSGVFMLPAKACDDNHWIVVRTSASDSSLPSEGTRINPCYAGVSSLPNRPAFSCPSSQNVMAKIVYPQGSGSGPLFLAGGANHYRLVGLEVTRVAGTGNITHLLSVKKDGAADHIIVDRVWMHGTARDETKDGVHLSNVTFAAVIDSYFNDFHCISQTGSCTDAQTVNGGTGSLPAGPFKIVNNFLEASGEGILMGGGPATTTPADIEIRRNHFYKPMQWMPGYSGFIGAANGNPFIVKNHLELKNAQRVLVEGNIMENTWGGFSQSGYSILLTPKNQHMNDTNVCPICQVTDVTIRLNTLSHAASGIQIATGISGDGANGGMALAGARFSIHDITIDDIRAQYFKGNGTLFQVSNSWTANVLNSISISHISGFTDSKGHLLSVGNSISNPSMWGFSFVNNIVLAGAYPVWSTGGGDMNCAASDIPTSVLQACFSSYSFANNAIVAATSAFSASRWPASNYFVADPSAIFVNYSSGDYRLSSASLQSAATTDGKMIGADIDAIKTAISGVY